MAGRVIFRADSGELIYPFLLTFRLRYA